MPIYEFHCAMCGASTEHLMRLSDPDPTACPACHAPSLARVLSAPSFRLAGGGWYETDFKGDKDRKRNLAGDGGESKPATQQDAPAPAAAKADTGTSTATPASTSKPASPSAPS